MFLYNTLLLSLYIGSSSYHDVKKGGRRRTQPFVFFLQVLVLALRRWVLKEKTREINSVGDSETPNAHPNGEASSRIDMSTEHCSRV